MKQYDKYLIVGEPMTINGHTGQVRTNDGSRYPTSCVFECLTCNVTITYCWRLHKFCAPAYLQEFLNRHITEYKP